MNPPKKAATKDATAKKAAAKKGAARKAVVQKAVAKKAAAGKAPPTRAARTAVTKAAAKAPAQKAATKKARAEKAATKKAATKKAVTKKAGGGRRAPRRPTGPVAAGFLVTPGASADRDNRTLVALEEGLPLPVERVTIRSRAARKVHEQLREDMGDFADRLGVESSELVIGGRSFGGRMCSMLVAAGEPVAGLVLLSYPLHPPGKPDDLRVDHFADITVPTLFVSGTNDPFASPEELERHAGAIAGPVDFVWLEDEPHAPRDDAAVVAAVAGWLRST